MSARKPKIVYYWTLWRPARSKVVTPLVNWRLVGANGEVMCQSTQGFRDKTDAQRSVEAVRDVMTVRWRDGHPVAPREVGPGRKPT